MDRPFGTARRPSRLRARRRAGITILEIVAGLAVMTVASLLYAQVSLSLQQQRTSTYESGLAADAAQKVLETMRGTPHEQVWASWNEDYLDDPHGPGTAPGAWFAVDGLEALGRAEHRLVGKVHLPGVQVAPRVWSLREDQELPVLGLPRDLNGDSIIDGSNQAYAYVQLPVRITVDWQSRFGPRHFELNTMLVRFER